MAHQATYGRLLCGFGLAILQAISNSGCAVRYPTGVIPVKLKYETSEREKVTAQFRGGRLRIEPIEDARSDYCLYDQNEYCGIATWQRVQLMLDDSANVSAWMTHAIQLELGRAGATVEMSDEKPADAQLPVLSGQVSLLKAEPAGTGALAFPGALATKCGYKPRITVNLAVHQNGTRILNRTYNIEHTVPADALYLWLTGGRRPPPSTDVPPACAKVLKKLIRDQILPDLAEALKTGASMSAAGS